MNATPSPHGNRRPSAVVEAIKSLLVAPAVIGIVLLLAFGLVRLAHSRQEQSGTPAPSPIHADADGKLKVDLLFTEIHGEMGFGGRNERRALHQWEHPHTAASWHFPIEKPGAYRVELDYACDPKQAGSDVRILLAGSALDHRVVGTAEAPEEKDENGEVKKRAKDDRHQFDRRLVDGVVNIPATGWYDLEISAAKVAHDWVMNLRGVRLIPQ